MRPTWTIVSTRLVWGWTMPSEQCEWDDSVVDVADELVKEYSADGAIDRLQTRRQTRNEDLKARCNEAIAWIRREVMDDS